MDDLPLSTTPPKQTVLPHTPRACYGGFPIPHSPGLAFVGDAPLSPIEPWGDEDAAPWHFDEDDAVNPADMEEEIALFGPI